MTVTSEATSGIPNTSRPGHWIVPPWRAGASVCGVVRHFLRFYPRHDTGIANQLAYYEGYQAAMEAAPTYELTYPCDWHWYEDLRACVAHCVAIHQGQRAPESGKQS